MGGAYTLNRPYPANEQVSISHSDLNAKNKSVLEYVCPLSLIVKFFFPLVFIVTLNHGAEEKSMKFFRSFFDPIFSEFWLLIFSTPIKPLRFVVTLSEIGGAKR